MIRQSPEVPGAVELGDVARHISRHQFMFPDPRYENGWVWQSQEDFEPNLRVVVPRSSKVFRKGRFIISKAVMVVVEQPNEYRLNIPIVGADHINDDPYIEDFVQAFRQYQLGRSPVELDLEEVS